MRILLVQNLMYVPAHGGANKANRQICERLAARGHACDVIATSGGMQTTRNGAVEDVVREMGGDVEAPVAGERRFRLHGVAVRALDNPARLRPTLAETLRANDYDVVLVSSEDAFQVLLGQAVEICAPKVVYLAHTTLLLPFGPACMAPHPPSARLLARTGGIVAFSTFMQDYLRRWGGLEARVLRAPLYGNGPYPDLARFGGELLMVNPCAVKGLPIFLGLADRCPERSFVAVRSWGTTEADVAALRRRANVRVLDPVERIDDVLACASAVLVPSLWQEAFGLVAIEAMLRGLPVLASDTGGLPEAKLGVEYTVPVAPIERYTGAIDDRFVPRAIVPEQDLRPWVAAIDDLYASESRYLDVSTRGRAVAADFVRSCGLDPLEAYLRDVASSINTRAAGRALE